MIDIRELRIGSSVLLNGKRVKVEGIVIQNGIVFFENDNAYADILEPIPITEGLLKELGFEKSETNQYDWYKHIDDFSIFIKIFKRGRCRAEVYSEFSHHGNMVCWYLHELEAFVYLTTKQELI